MTYLVKKINTQQVEESKNLLWKGFSRSKNFWNQSIKNYTSYLNHLNIDQIGYGLYSDDSLCGIILVIPAENQEYVSISSLFVLKDHRNYSILFIKQVLDNLRDKTVLDFTASEDVKKILKAFKFKQIRKHAFLRLPIPTMSSFKIKSLSNDEANNFCEKKNIFFSPNMRVLVFKNKKREAFAIFKDVSITKNNSFRNLSILVNSSDLNDEDIKAFAFYNALRFKIGIDFIQSQSNYCLKFRRFSVFASKDTSCDHIGNSELSLFNF